MPAPTIYPKADATTQWFANTWQDGIMPLTAPVLVLHTTECWGWPDYQGGSEAPNFTIWPGVGIRQHFPVNMGSRALMNQPGGVETNGQGAIQIELMGTCAQGGPGLFWPSATDANMVELADLVRWLRDNWGLKIQSSVQWVAYPASYGFNAAQRLSGPAWVAYEGILGHQHVPENDHGDPGLFPIQRLMALVNGTGLPGGSAPAPATTTTPTQTGVPTDMTPDQLSGAPILVGYEKNADGTDDKSKPVYWDLAHVLGNIRAGNAQTQSMLRGQAAQIDALGKQAGVDVQSVYDAAVKGASQGVQDEISGATITLQAAPAPTPTTPATGA